MYTRGIVLYIKKLAFSTVACRLALPPEPAPFRLDM